MNKKEFVKSLRAKIKGLPEKEIEERINFYIEIIDDKIEEGLTEEQAVLEIGPIDEIAKQIIADSPNVSSKRKKEKRLKPIEITLLILGSPIWIALMACAFAIVVALVAVVFSVCVAMWSVIVSLWAVFGSLGVSGFAVIIVGVVHICCGKIFAGLFMVGSSLVCCGLCILSFFACKWITAMLIKVTKMIALGVSKIFVKKEAKK